MGETERECRKRMWLCPMAICFCGGSLWKRQAQIRDQNCAILCGNFVNIKDCSMLSGQWIRLRSSDRGFESQSHHQSFYQFIFESCHVEKTKRNTKEAVIKKFVQASRAVDPSVPTILRPWVRIPSTTSSFFRL